MIKRRQFIAGLGSAVAWPVAARAQQQAVPVIGFLDFGSSETTDVAAFREGLGETGFIEGRNLAIEYRFANFEVDRLPELAADLVRRRVAVIAAFSGSGAALAVKASTKTIPIVFQTGDDPVQSGLVASFNRPGGNTTGVTSMNVEIVTKRLELLHAMAPGAAPIALLIKPDGPGKVGPGLELMIKATQAAGASIGRQIEVLTTSSEAEIDSAFISLIQKRVGALMVAPQAFFVDRRVQIVTLAARHAMPAISFHPSFAEAGGLMSYGLKSYDDMARQGGIYVGRILKGENAGDLPVMRPTRFAFVINLKTAKALGLTIPETLLATADQVIE
jgi:putative ABC transport system substrate-binding protein